MEYVSSGATARVTTEQPPLSPPLDPTQAWDSSQLNPGAQSAEVLHVVPQLPSAAQRNGTQLRVVPSVKDIDERPSSAHAAPSFATHL